MHLSQMLLGIYQQHTARRRQRQGKRHGNKLLTEADLDVLPKFKLTLDSLVDIKRAHARRRHLVAPRAAPPREIALPQPAYLHAVPSYSSTASLPEIGRGSTSASPINPDIQRQSIDGTILALSEHAALADNIDDAESRYTPTETGPPSCVICLEEYVVDDEVRVLPCGHVFHDQCITPWLLRPKSKFHECPMCKTPCFPEEAARKAKEEAAGLSSDDDQRNAPTNLVSVF
ncbi:E3 ubiquitin-protein ligase rnf13 [Coemansia spiralis]|uniref:E3 ubiquitin-protein ligase rnf13 n=2 Tax=Coemansia TaxID=4863 RepID=A0A9W8FYT4_9FUNG|nr:E3 ubiquitin-protein ligase rnf13 [Coemansia umbellata]KAJ2619699.1 E3 ubiquitin-protein ligase rnf13 [Coemansia sp. RSA 1358]KAJ2671848.1 E3 ubiquitin-protein ligase rnf13 [Coemansia spiralis]